MYKPYQLQDSLEEFEKLVPKIEKEEEPKEIPVDKLRKGILESGKKSVTTEKENRS